MSEFSPEDGVVFFAWRNTFSRVSQRTYDWTYRRNDLMDGAGVLIEEIPYRDGNLDIQWVRLLHERIFVDEGRLGRYLTALVARYTKTYGDAVPALRTLVANPRSPSASVMYYDNGTLVLPSPSAGDAHHDDSGDAITRERFIASRWLDQQRHWPIAEHHVLHEVAHHISGSDQHDGRFTDVFRNLLTLASADANFTLDIWDWESLLASRLLEDGGVAIDMVTSIAYAADGSMVVGDSLATV